MNQSSKKYAKKRDLYLRESQDRPGNAILSNLKVGIDTSDIYKEFLGGYACRRLRYDDNPNFNSHPNNGEVYKNEQRDQNIRNEYKTELFEHANEMRGNFTQLSDQKNQVIQKIQIKKMFNSYLKKCSTIYDDFIDFYENNEKSALMKNVLYSLNRALFDLKALAYSINNKKAISWVNSIEKYIASSLNDCIYTDTNITFSEPYEKGGLTKRFKLW